METLWPDRIATPKWLIAANYYWLGMIYPTLSGHRTRERTYFEFTIGLSPFWRKFRRLASKWPRTSRH